MLIIMGLLQNHSIHSFAHNVTHPTIRHLYTTVCHDVTASKRKAVRCLTKIKTITMFFFLYPSLQSYTNILYNFHIICCIEIKFSHLNQ